MLTDIYSKPTTSFSAESPFLLQALRRWKLIVAVAVGCFTLAAIGIFSLPKRYESVMKLLVKSERQDLVVSPSSNSSAMSPHPGGASESQINSEIELLKSNDLLQQVVLNTPLNRHEPGTVEAAGEVSPVTLQGATQSLSKSLQIKAVKKSDIIEVAYRAANPALASSVLNELANRYMTEHLKAHNTPGAFTFFQAQAISYERQLRDAEAELAAFRQRYSGLVMPDDKDALVQRAVDTQSALEDTNVQVAALQEKVKRQRGTLAQLDPRVTTQITTSAQQGLVAQLSQTLNDLQNKRTDLIVKFRPDDRLVKNIDQQIADTKASLDRASKITSTSQVTDLNRLRQTAEGDLLQSVVDLAAQKQRQAQLANLTNVYKQRMFSLAGVTVQEEALVRRVKEAEQDYLLYSQKREEARIGESLDRERITNVAIVQTPTVPALPTSPRITLDLILAAFLSVCIGITVAIGVEFVRNQFAGSDARRNYAVATATGD